MIGVYPGSFDPLTLGHYDIILRASKICKTLYIGVSENINKNHCFTIDERVDMAYVSLSHIPNIIVESFNGLLINYVLEKKADCIFRGLRAVSDFDYEFQLALANRSMNQDCETIFMVPDQKYIFLSSTIVRDIASHKGSIDNLVPEVIKDKILNKFI